MTRWTRFASVGLLGFLVQVATLYVMTALLHVPSLIAVVIAVEAAILHNFIWHERWTWRDRLPSSSHSASLERLLRFNAASGALSVVGNVAFTAAFVAAHVPVMAANILAVGCLSLVNYLIADRFAYREARTPATRAPMSLSRRALVPRSFFLWLAVIAAVAPGASIHAAELTPATIAAWNRYVADVEDRRAQESRDASRFLALDFENDAQRADARTRLRRTEVVVRNVAGSLVDVGAGTVSHWRGLIFVPGVSLDDLVEDAAMRKPESAYRQDDVLEARVLGRGPDSLRLFLKLQRRDVVTLTYNTEHAVSYHRVGPDRAVSRSISTRIAELRDAGSPGETEKPVGQDRGFLWRLQSYWRYQATSGGVIVELESLTLSRDVPWAIRVVAGPMIERVARESMVRTLTALRTRCTLGT